MTLEDLRRSDQTRAQITVMGWTPEELSASFHRRDLFAPVAAMLARADRDLGLGVGAPLEIVS